MSLFEKYKVVPLEELHKVEWNYKEDDIVLAEKLKQNIRTNGQIENLIIGKVDGSDKYSVLNGNHRIDAMKDLGSKVAVCCDLGEVTLAQAQRIAIETNETKFPIDTMKLSQLIQDIATTYSIEDLEQSLPYSHEELQFFIDADLGADPIDTDSSDDIDSIDSSDAVEKKCPACGYVLD
jgi:ParB-like chromosome segregation protein Spo0J